MRTLQEENAKLKETLAARESDLSRAKEQLASLNRDASGEDRTAHASESAVLEGTAHPHCLMAVEAGQGYVTF